MIFLYKGLFDFSQTRKFFQIFHQFTGNMTKKKYFINLVRKPLYLAKMGKKKCNDTFNGRTLQKCHKYVFCIFSIQKKTLYWYKENTNIQSEPLRKYNVREKIKPLLITLLVCAF